MKKVILGLSGGVDSSVSVIMLQKAGYEVEGIYIQNLDSKQEDDLNLIDARRVAQITGIKFHVVNLVSENNDYVFNYFIDEYKNGRTPSPCIMCNKNIKFKAFLDFAQNLGGDYIAMGHYAQTEVIDGVTYLKKGFDKNKDQTYFLCMLTKEQISKTLFPVGHLDKPTVRQIALENNLVTARKKDSMDICFVGKDKFNDFIDKYIAPTPGPMMTLDGKKVGTHNGLCHYTIGQRKGLQIGGLNGYSNEPWFSIGKDLDKNILYVGQGFHNPYLYSNKCICKNYNFNAIPLDENKEYGVKFRYRSEDVKAKIKVLNETEILVTYEDTARAVTPGQGCAIYDNDYCLGGAIIDRVFMDDEERKY